MHNKTKGELTRERIIEEAAKLFLKKGYANTSLKDILDKTNLAKGSFYFQFKSKTELGVAVAEYYREGIKRWFNLRVHESEGWSDFIKKIVADINDKVRTGEYYGCPFTIFATEISVTEPEIRKHCEAALIDFVEIFKRQIEKDESKKEQSEKLAVAALNLYEGFMVSYRITFNPRMIQYMEEALSQFI